ncbi:hypothetical protein BKA80DRAFT_254574 [Phyllosticta citrichinensis]
MCNGSGRFASSAIHFFAGPMSGLSAPRSQQDCRTLEFWIDKKSYLLEYSLRSNASVHSTVACGRRSSPWSRLWGLKSLVCIRDCNSCSHGPVFKNCQRGNALFPDARFIVCLVVGGVMEVHKTIDEFSHLSRNWIKLVQQHSTVARCALLYVSSDK